MNEKGNLNEYDDLNSIDVCVFPISKSKLDPISKSSSNLDPNPNEEDIVMDVEDLLQLALEERKGKQEAKLVKKNFIYKKERYSRKRKKEIQRGSE